ncbi:MAG TPA: nucleoside triphosphate pyrophosphohydrolase [Cytophagaceae bacterium]|jgi:tetrapyrrole methylase family protein/MazG family protein|nr:nucleoside triphosphate pyrophosphohydrolase [Cytophagaceae bacterium]
MNDSPRLEETLQSFANVLKIMDELREQCPWDKKQTIDSLRYLTIEETFELSDAIVEKNMDEIKKEIGDILLHLVFYSRIASETGDFTIKDVMDSLCEKLIRRHPHIYGNAVAEDEEAVKKNWEQIKQTEKGGNKTILSGVPKSLPAMVKAIRIQEKARGAGFDWDNKDQVWEKVKEELDEFEKEAHAREVNKEKMEDELGDIFFSIINYSRFIDINPEDALERTNKKFIKRFSYLEEKARESGKKLHEMTLDEMNVYWEEAKKK